VIGGIATNLEMQRRIVAHPVFRKGAYGTGFIAEAFKEGAA
jgi:acetyl/propionyl-CoA carboxylase alpha subunit